MSDPDHHWADRMVLGNDRRAIAAILTLMDGTEIRLDRGTKILAFGGNSFSREREEPIAVLPSILRHPDTYIEWETENRRHHVHSRGVMRVTLVTERKEWRTDDPGH